MKDLDVKHKRLLELSRLVRHGIPEIEFDMGAFIGKSPHCKTTACIAGYAVACYEPERFTLENADKLEEFAADILELSFRERKNLFYARTDGTSFILGSGKLSTIKAAHAARVLEHFALTNRIDWSQ